MATLPPPGMEPPPMEPPGKVDTPRAASPGTATASSTAAAPVLRGPPSSAAEVAVGVEAPPPPAGGELMRLEPPLPPPNESPGQENTRIGSALANFPSMPKLPFGAPSVPKIRLGCRRRIWACLLRAPPFYCEYVARFPSAFLLFYSLIVVAAISAGWREFNINTDIEAFRETGGNATRFQHSYMEALKFQKAVKNSSDLADRTTFEVQLIYEAKAGSVFSEAALRDVRVNEALLRNLPGWKRMCELSEPSAIFRCDPGESLGNYAWPDREELRQGLHTPFKLQFNGGSRERLPVHAFLTYLHEGLAAPHDLRKFLPQQFSGPQQDTTLLRSIFAFTAPSLDDTSFREEYKKFIAEELFPALTNATERAAETPDDPWIEPWSVHLYFRGTEIEAHEVRYYLAGDLEWAIGALVVTFLVTWVQLRSLFLAFFGLVQVCLVPLIAYVIVPIDEVSLATFLCIFLVIGLSSNDLLAVKEYWSRIGRDCEYPDRARAGEFGYKYEMDRYYATRLSRTFQALLLRFLPQFMTMCSWLVLLLSLIRPIREFGMFMFTSTFIACILCVAVFPPLLVVHEAYIKPCVHRRLHWIPATALEPSKLRFPWRPIVRKCLKIATNRRFAMIIWAGTIGVSSVVFVITMAVALNKDNVGLPEVYSPSHHGNAGRPLINAFSPTSPALSAASVEAVVCELSSSSVVNPACPAPPALHWCEAPQAGTTTTTTLAEGAEAAPPPDVACTCYRPPAPTGGAVDYVAFEAVLTGDSFKSANDTVRTTAWQNYIQATWFKSKSIDYSKGSATPLSSLVLEHWESGATDVEPVLQMPVAQIKIKDTANAPSNANTVTQRALCYCGKRACKQSGGLNRDSNKLTLPGVSQPAQGRRLTAPQNPSASAVEVTVLFGISATAGDGLLEGKESSTTWSYDTTFVPVSPWAQRAMLKMCTGVPSNLNVLESQCWIEHFKKWSQDRGEKFPIQRFGDFHGSLKLFLREKNDVPITAMWFNEDNTMVATAFAFKTPAPQAKVSEILEDRKRWLDYVHDQNEAAATSASQAWATSSTWAEAEAEHEAMSNAWHVAMLSCGICLAACLLYTWDFVFVGIVVFVALLAMVFLAFFMVCIFQWSMGPWEVILLVSYLMYSVEPALRIGRGTVWGGWLAAEQRLAGNAITPMPLPALTSGDGAPAILDDSAGGADMDDPVSRDMDHPASDNSSTNSPTDDYSASATARSGFEGRLQLFTLNVSNATFGAAVKLILCGMMALPCEFRLFTRLGAVSMMVPLFSLPCIFILVPSALVLLPLREKPDLVTLVEKLYGMMYASRLE